MHKRHDYAVVPAAHGQHAIPTRFPANMQLAASGGAACAEACLSGRETLDLIKALELGRGRVMKRVSEPFQAGFIGRLEQYIRHLKSQPPKPLQARPHVWDEGNPPAIAANAKAALSRRIREAEEAPTDEYREAEAFASGQIELALLAGWISQEEAASLRLRLSGPRQAGETVPAGTRHASTAGDTVRTALPGQQDLFTIHQEGARHE